MATPEVEAPGEEILVGGSRRRVNRWALFALPGVALLAVFFVYPAIHIMVRSVSEFTPPKRAA